MATTCSRTSPMPSSESSTSGGVVYCSDEHQQRSLALRLHFLRTRCGLSNHLHDSFHTASPYHRLKTTRLNNGLNPLVSVCMPDVLSCVSKSTFSRRRESGTGCKDIWSSRCRSVIFNSTGQRFLQVWQHRSFDFVRYSKPLVSPLLFPQQGHFPCLYLSKARSKVRGSPTVLRAFPQIKLTPQSNEPVGCLEL